MLHPASLTRILGVPQDAVEVTWPLVCGALHAQGILSDRVEVAAAATILVEVGKPFMPIRERGGEAYFIEHYWTNQDVRQRLGNLSPEDAVLFCGRGLIQLSGRSNYDRFGKRIGVDLLSEPDRALQPETAALLFADYFKVRGVDLAAGAGNWRLVRKRVNGGFNNWDLFIAAVNGLLGVIGG